LPILREGAAEELELRYCRESRIHEPQTVFGECEREKLKKGQDDMADAAVYRIIDKPTKRLRVLGRASMEELNLKETTDLESWLASSGGELFGREILWIARQDSPATEQRSDLVGIEKDSGDVLVVELKRGDADADAVKQVLGYAAEYAEMDYEALLGRYREHAQKASGLLLSPQPDAESRLKDFLGEVEVNESQILMLVAEGFSETAMAICDYLNRRSGDASYSFELWRYSLCIDGEGSQEQRFFVLEQILPPFNAREEIERRREASRSPKRVRDSVRMDYRSRALEYVEQHGYNVKRHSKQYSFWVSRREWTGEVKLSFERWQQSPALTVPKSLRLPDRLPVGVTARDLPDGGHELTLGSLSIEKGSFTENFGQSLDDVLKALPAEVPKGLSHESA
jgi:hypothetical protein